MTAFHRPRHMSRPKLSTEPVIETVEETESTNSALKKVASAKSHGYMLAAVSQTAGRGQRGNTWESEPGANATFSLLLKPEYLRPDEQFHISEAVALGVAQALDGYLPEELRPTVKWPNDIYVGDRKIAGILIENTIGAGGHISHSVAGVGVNLNQKEFLSDAPNPVSLVQLTGREIPVEEFLRVAGQRILELFAAADSGKAKRDELHRLYLSRLWRRKGEYTFRLPDGTEFRAAIVSVAPDGRLTLYISGGAYKFFYFKEVAFVV